MEHRKFSRRLFLKGVGVGVGAELFAFGRVAESADTCHEPGYKYQNRSFVDDPEIHIRLQGLGITPEQSFVSYNGGQLKAFHAALSDPFMQFLGVCFVGDSITWGMTATGIGCTLPRAGRLKDARNNSSSATWVNMLHKWMGDQFFASGNYAEQPWPGSPSGSAEFIYSKAIDNFPGSADFDSEGGFCETVSTVSGAGPVWAVDLSSAGGGKHSFSWTMTGKEFDVRFAALSSGADYKVYVDGDFAGQYSTSSVILDVPSRPGESRTHRFRFRTGAVVRIEAATGKLGGTLLQIEAIRINKTLRVTNNGVIGLSAEQYRKNILAHALRHDDSYCFIQLGTNDSAMPPGIFVETSPKALKATMENLLDQVVEFGATPMLLCANEVLDNQKRYYTMAQVRAVIANLAAIRGIDFIDNFSQTKPLEMDGVDYLDDNLHPNDLGHRLIFDNVRNSITGQA